MERGGEWVEWVDGERVERKGVFEWVGVVFRGGIEFGEWV